MDEAAGGPSMSEPLSGFRVVELAVALQGPAAAMFLGDMGAEVIKVEPPIGEAARYHRGVNNSLPREALSSQFIAANRGKKSINLDANSDIGREAILRLVDSADVFLSNFRREALERMGLGYEVLHRRNPRLVYALANGFGPEGPDTDRAMIDGAAAARGGLVALTGSPEGPPTPCGAAVADMTGAMQLALGVMTALLARERYGMGQRVHTSAYGGQLWLQQWELTHGSITGQALERVGAYHPNIQAMYGIYETSDGEWIFFGVPMTNESWDAFCVFAELPELAIDPHWDQPAKRLGLGAETKATDELRELLCGAFRTKPASDWVAFLRSEPEIIYERVHSHAEVLRDPQALANDYLVEVDLVGVGPARLVGPLIHFSQTPVEAKGPPPSLGEHNDEILGSLGYSDEERNAIYAASAAAALEALKAVGIDPSKLG
jgi:crotonobetainyl-CoA:carnitine CoA-transferase CaiB-like acyl-CoA transferase